MAWAGSCLLRRENYSLDRSFGQLETIDYRRGDRHLRGEDTLARNRSTQLRVGVLMTAQRRLLGRYAVVACMLGTAMVLHLVLVGDGVCRFPPGLG